MDRWDNELYHHGVLGMRWGHRKQEFINIKNKKTGRKLTVNRREYNAERRRLGGTTTAIGGTFGAAIGAVAGGGKGALIGASIGASAGVPFFSKAINNIGDIYE